MRSTQQQHRQQPQRAREEKKHRRTSAGGVCTAKRGPADCGETRISPHTIKLASFSSPAGHRIKESRNSL